MEAISNAVRIEQRRLARDIDHANSVRDVARILDVSDRTVWRWVRAGELKAERLSPRCLRIFDSEIARFRANARG